MTDQPADYDPFAWFYETYWSRGLPAQFMSALDQLLLPLLPARARVLDLCCGVGQVAAQLAARGYAVTGLDVSAEMLRYARRRAPGIEFITADARTYSAPPTYAAVVSTFDSLNHLLSLKDLTAVCRNVHDMLTAGGWFCFDMHLERGFRQNWQEDFSVVEPDKVCVVRGHYDTAAKLGRYHFTLLRRTGRAWQRTDFVIAERCYTRAEIVRALRLAGFRTVRVFDAVRAAGLTDHAGRLFFRARKEPARAAPPRAAPTPRV